MSGVAWVIATLDAAMAAAQHRREGEGEAAEHDAADEGPQPARQLPLLQDGFDAGHGAHRDHADQGRRDAGRGEIEEVDIAGRHLVRDDDQRGEVEEGPADHRGGHRRHADRGQRGEGIGADHQLEGVEGTAKGALKAAEIAAAAPQPTSTRKSWRRKRRYWPMREARPEPAWV